MAAARTLILVGPTAAGKTAVALALRDHWPVEVVSADARQVYRGLDVVTAKPTPRERMRVPHHLVDIVPLGERYSAGRFALDAASAIASIRQRGRVPVVVGGTGLYLKALIDGLFAEPPLDRPRRDALMRVTASLDHPTLVRWAARLNPGAALAGGRQRAARAIEIALLTGQPLSWWQRSAAVQGQVLPWIVRLTLPRPVLHQRIEARVNDMLARGLVEEVAAAMADGHSGPGMDSVGVRETIAMLQGSIPRSELVTAIATSTRQYAKRQETWFRHQLHGPILSIDATRPPAQLAAQIAAAWQQAAA